MLIILMSNDKRWETLKKRGLKKEYSQEYVGIQLGIGQVEYHKLESGKTTLKIDTLIKLAIILDVNTTYFYKNKTALI
jgi:transcriptional regulator with XRE-family HTH domain|tara:strand:- start:28924 stop:29157 length:234 start_codon:yes stop_codon:yes gene_type:complete